MEAEIKIGKRISSQLPVLREKKPKPLSHQEQTQNFPVISIFL